MTNTTIRELFTEHENRLTAGLPDLVAVGYVNARRRAGKGERASVVLSVVGNKDRS